MTKNFFNLVIFTVIAFLLGACAKPNPPSKTATIKEEKWLEFSKSDLRAKTEWETPPSFDSKAPKFTLKFWNKNTGSSNGPYQFPAQPVKVYATMVDCTCRIQANLTKKAEGVFEVVFTTPFSMKGKWSVHIEFLQRGAVDEAQEELINVEG